MSRRRFIVGGQKIDGPLSRYILSASNLNSGIYNSKDSVDYTDSACIGYNGSYRYFTKLNYVLNKLMPYCIDGVYYNGYYYNSVGSSDNGNSYTRGDSLLFTNFINNNYFNSVTIGTSGVNSSVKYYKVGLLNITNYNYELESTTSSYRKYSIQITCDVYKLDLNVYI